LDGFQLFLLGRRLLHHKKIILRGEINMRIVKISETEIYVEMANKESFTVNCSNEKLAERWIKLLENLDFLGK
jgi:hypothetical protein